MRDTESPRLFNHSARVYLFGALTGQRHGLRFDTELLYAGAMFHDVGLVDAYSSATERFDVDGANAAANAAAPDIAGSWVVPLPAPSAKGEKAFRFIVEQQGAEVAATILRVDGDTGSYSGGFKDGKWVLSHFDGSRPGLIVVTPNADGTLSIRQRSDRPAAAAGDGHDHRQAGGEEAQHAGNLACRAQTDLNEPCATCWALTRRE